MCDVRNIGLLRIRIRSWSLEDVYVEMNTCPKRDNKCVTYYNITVFFEL